MHQPNIHRFPRFSSGSGVLAVPYAFGLINYWALLLLFLVVGLTAFTACLIGNLEAYGVKGRW